jgi:dTDP-4-dehydrorhamnose reductase
VKNHVIIGLGNLGYDLKHYLDLKPKNNVTVYSRSTGYDIKSNNCKDIVTAISKANPDFVWLTTAGRNSDQNARLFHIDLPWLLRNELPESTNLVCFSSGDAVHPNHQKDPSHINLRPRSIDAQLKIEMELALERMEKPSIIIRACHLYGDYKPQDTYPYRALKNFTNPKISLRLPQNTTTPTPTRWIANLLSQDNVLKKMSRKKNTHKYHVAPSGFVSMRDWSIMILNGMRHKRDFNKETDNFWDHSKPYHLDIGCDFGLSPHWYSLWKDYFKVEKYIQKQ